MNLGDKRETEGTVYETPRGKRAQEINRIRSERERSDQLAITGDLETLPMDEVVEETGSSGDIP